MSFSDFLRTVIECAAGGFIIWGFFNEDKFVRFERRILIRLRRLFCRKGSNLRVTYGGCTYSVIDGCDKIA